MSASTIAVITTSDWSEYGGVQTYSCPAKHVEGTGGALYLWPKSAKPIVVPWAWVYWLRFIELPSGDSLTEGDGPDEV